MKKLLLTIGALIGIALGSTAKVSLSPLDRLSISNFKEQRVAAAFAGNIGEAARLGALGMAIELAPGYSEADLEAAGATVRSRIGDYVIACVKEENLDQLLASPAIAGLNIASPLKLHNDLARQACFIDDVHAGTSGLPSSYTGKGVLLGIFDVGIDFTHPNFLNADGKSRVKHAWIYNGFSMTEYSTESQIAALTTDTGTESHGSHTLGIAAGSYKSNEYYGMAPDADLLVAAGSLYNDNVVDAIKRMLAIAKDAGRPLVVNLSIGINYGPHDGSTVFNRAIDELCAQGAIVVMSAGNEGYANMAVKKTLTADDTQMKIILKPQGTLFKGDLILYSKDGTPFDMEVTFWDTKGKKAISTISSESLNASSSVSKTSGAMSVTSYFPSGTTFDFIYGIDPDNNRYCRSMSLNGGTMKSTQINIILTLTGTAGNRIEGYIDDYEGLMLGSGASGVTGITPGTSDGSISDIACGKNVIVVGAWTSVPSESDYGEMAYFSSYGTLIDGRELPHIAAPGRYLMSSVNSYSSTTPGVTATYGGKTYGWAYMQGTSMAAPFVAGTVATWLQAKPTMGFGEVRDVMQSTAQKLQKSTSIPVQWGAGLINGLDGVKKVLGIAGVDDLLADGNMPMTVTETAPRVYEAFVPGQSTVSVTAWSITGQRIASATTGGDTATIDLSDAPAGAYVLTVSTPAVTASHKVLVR